MAKFQRQPTDWFFKLVWWIEQNEPVATFNPDSIQFCKGGDFYVTIAACRNGKTHITSTSAQDKKAGSTFFTNVPFPIIKRLLSTYKGNAEDDLPF